MANKYEVLYVPDETKPKHAIICKVELVNGKNAWEIYVPDAGEANTAKKLARLLNAEHDQNEERLKNRVI